MRHSLGPGPWWGSTGSGWEGAGGTGPLSIWAPCTLTLLHCASSGYCLPRQPISRGRVWPRTLSLGSMPTEQGLGGHLCPWCLLQTLSDPYRHRLLLSPRGSYSVGWVLHRSGGWAALWPVISPALSTHRVLKTEISSLPLKH